MIDQDIFLERLIMLGDWFKKEIPENSIKTIYKMLSEQLTTEEFIQACDRALYGKFFPSIGELIDSVLGTVEERAEREWENLEQLSVVGLKALNAIGGWWYVKHQCTQPAIARKDFIESYCRHAKGASREDFAIPDPIALLAPVEETREWSYLPIGTKHNKRIQQIETRWKKVFIDEAFTDDIPDEVREQWIAIYLDNYAARNLRLVDGIHTKANADVPQCWEQYARPNLQWLHDRARLYLKNLEGTDNEL